MSLNRFGKHIANMPAQFMPETEVEIDMRKRTGKRVKSIIAGILTLSLVFLGGCGENNVAKESSASQGGVVANDDTLKSAVGAMTDLSVVDPIIGYNDETDMILNSIVEGLFYYDTEGNVKPRLVKDYEQKDQTTYVYQIRDDVKFSDGTELTADDVVFSLERHRDSSNASLLAWMFDSVDTIEKTGDYEVTVKLKQPAPMWQNSLCTPAGNVISKKYYEEHKDGFGTAKGGILGSGPYTITKWETNSEIDMEYNEDYWDKDSAPEFKKLVYKVIPDSSVVKLALESGEIDYTENISIEGAKELENNDKVDVHPIDTLWDLFLSFNNAKEPFGDKNVRKAVAYAIDKTAIRDSVWGEKYAEVAKSLQFSDEIVVTQKELWGDYFDTIEPYEHDLEKAKKYLAESSAPDGFDATLAYDSGNAQYEAVALAIQQNLAEIGINITLQASTSSEINNYRYGGPEEHAKYDLMLTLWGSDYPDPVGTVVPMFYSTANIEGGSNWTEYVSQDYDKFIDAAAVAKTPEDRVEQLKKALDVLADDIPSIPIVNNYNTIATSSRIEYPVSSLGLYNTDFRKAKKK